MSKNIRNSSPKPTQKPSIQNDKPTASGGGRNGVPPSKYEEMQRDEMEVLRSIYMEDFEYIESKKAWSKATDTSFKLKLFAYSDKDIWIYLSARLTATYPATEPLLHLGEAKNVRPQTLEKIQKIISSKSKDLLGEVMIHEIASLVQDELENAASAKAHGDKLPSLEEERAVQEAAAYEVAREQEAEIKRRDDEQKLREDQAMQRMFDEQVKKREGARVKATHENLDSVGNEQIQRPNITFDQAITASSETKGEQIFRSVSLMTVVGRGKVTTVYSALPITRNEFPSTLIVKRASTLAVKSKQSVFTLEKQLETLKKLHHSSTINILDFKVQNDNEQWKFDVLTEYANKGSLRDLLSLVEYIPVQRARRLGLELLQALDFYHRNGIAHGRVHPGNVLLHIGASGNISTKLADAGFQSALYSVCLDSESSGKIALSEAAPWPAPELTAVLSAETSKKSDIWAFGVVLVQMLLGMGIVQRHSTPAAFMNSTPLSEPFDDLLRGLFKSDPKKRPSAFDVTPYEFFRVDVPIVTSDSNLSSRSGSAINLHPSLTPWSSKHETNPGPGLNSNSTSRYAKEWDELGRLGKGGFGEVVKARNKLDGRIYAIKKIPQKTPAELSQVLSEVYLLATLNHPYVVRYYTAWPEEESPFTDEASDELTSLSDLNFRGPESKQFSIGFGKSTGGLDFISSSGYPKIEFGYDDDDEQAVSDEGEEDSDASPVKNEQYISSSSNNLMIARTRSGSRPAVRSTLFIQMEYCERLTLRDIIRKGVQDNVDEIWRLFRQILEGLTHIHSHGIIHRDLKPENIFVDSASNVRIGDFGLAKSGQFSIADTDAPSKATDGDMTQNVGTAFYVAPELQTTIKGTYTDKIDMYSLGIIFFEMCHHLKTGMERWEVLTTIRQKDHALPLDFQQPDKAVQGEIIESLLKHRPSERPSSAELLRSGKVPLQIEDETIKIAIEGLSDDSSPYYHRMMSALFSKSSGRQIREQMWDMSGKDASHTPSIDFVLLQTTVCEKIVSCFRRHGAVESQRQGLLPRSDYYESKNSVQLLDASGTLVQLPYDYTLPHARAIANQTHVADKSYAIGMVYRDALTGGAPRISREADFDILSRDKKDLALSEAEVIKVVDELLDEFPPLASASMCFHLSHSDLLEHIMEFCRITMTKRPIVKDILGRLNIQQWTWQKIRTELRSATVGIPATSLDELAQFDFRDSPDKALAKLQNIFAGTKHMKQLHETFTHVSGLFEYCKRWSVRRPIYFSPLSSFNDKFYQGGVMFQCLFDGKKKDVVAAGGRYDRLVQDQRAFLSEGVQKQVIHAVGVNISWDRLVTSMARYQKSVTTGNTFLKKSEEPESVVPWPTRRCDALVACLDSTVLRSTGIRLVNLLWSQDISAELAVDVRSTEELLSHYREDKHSWIIIIKHEGTTSTKADLKIKSMDKKEDHDIRSSDLVSFMRAEIREREQREGANERQYFQRHHNASGDTSMSSHNNRKPQVQVLTSSHKSKKSNKFRVVEAAQAASQELLRSFGDGPVASIETTDEALDMIKETKLSDADSWRRVIQKVPPGERNYMQEVQQLLSDFRTSCLSQTGTGASFVFNFRTGKCIFYDLLA